jgi:hypothetical protein
MEEKPNNKLYLYHAHSAIHILEHLTEKLEEFQGRELALKKIMGPGNIRHAHRSTDPVCYVIFSGNTRQGLQENGIYEVEFFIHEKSQFLSEFQELTSGVRDHFTEGEIFEDGDVRTIINSVKLNKTKDAHRKCMGLRLVISYTLDSKVSQ